MLLYFHRFSRGVLSSDFLMHWDKVNATDGLIVLPDIVITLGTATMIIKGDTRTNDIDECCSAMPNSAFD